MDLKRRPRNHLTKPLLLLLALGIAPLAEGAEALSPSHLYTKYCSTCHGKTGKGDSIAANGMNPPPADFTRPRALVDLTREQMLKTVHEGRPGTAMVSWKGILSEEQIQQVVDYIRDSLMLSSGEESASLGRKLFAKNCSVCHGDKGDTATWARSGLSPAPRDFTTDQAKNDLTRERMIFSATYGRPETAMPAWQGRLSKEEIAAVVDYIRSAIMYTSNPEQASVLPVEPSHANHDNAAGDAPHNHNSHFNPEDQMKPMPKGLLGDLAWGEEFYQKNCSVCHGKEGDGKGPRSDFIFPKPRNFTHPSSLHKFSRPHLFEVISKGMPGTEMPSWNKVLTDQEIANVAEYISQHFIQHGLAEERKNNPAAQESAAGHGDHATQDAHGDHTPAAATPAPAQEAHHGHGDHTPAVATPAPAQEAHHGHGDHAPAAATPAPAQEAHHGHGDHAPAVATPAPEQEAHHGHDDHAPAVATPAPAQEAHHGHGDQAPANGETAAKPEAPHPDAGKSH